MRFSERSRFETTPNALSERVEARTAPYLDLTESNPTRAGLPVPTEAIARALAEGAAHPYAPDPLGPSSAREAVARELERTTGATVDPNRVLLTASTSEAYALLFQVLADPGDRVLVPAPSYLASSSTPARVEGLSAMPYELEYDGRGEVDLTGTPCPAECTGTACVNPQQPHGHGISAADWGTLADAELPMIVDEVFLEYALGETRLASALGRPGPLRFVLGGLSKYAGLPHM
ncbi:MAG: pyridoxal phosphate-dependent aminotransferase [Polyangiales bacterium]